MATARDDIPATERLRITEVFHSLQGEADSVGWPTVFVRLTGCPLRCRYCDTEYAFYGGEWWSIDAIVERVASFAARHVCVTGERNFLPNLDSLRPQDQVKFVISGRADYEWSRAFVAERRLAERTQVLFSPSFGEVEPRMLAEWLLEDRLPVRFQLQLHKVLWGEERGR